MTDGQPAETSSTPTPRRARWSRAEWVVVGAVVAALVIRILWAWWATRTPLGENDPVTYLGLAERVADGQGYVGPSGAPTAYFPPGWPVALGVLFWAADLVGVHGHRPELAAGFNVVLSTAVVGLMALVARRLFGWTVAAVVAVVLAVLPSFVGFSSLALSEPLFLFFMALALLLVVWRPLEGGTGGWVRLGGAALSLGAALLVRPQGALLVVAVLLGVLVAGGGARRVLARCALVVGVVAVVLVPWAVRNAVVMDAGLTLSTNTGDNLCIGNNPSANGTFQVPDYCFADLPDQEGPADVAEVARARATQQRAIDWMKDNLGAQLRLVLDRTLDTFQYGHYFRFSSQSYGADDWIDPRTATMLDVLGDSGWFAVLALGLCGLPALWGRRDARRTVLLASIIGMAVVSWPFFGVPRFGLPAVVLLVVPAALLLDAVPSVRARWRPVAGGPAPDPARDDPAHDGPAHDEAGHHESARRDEGNGRPVGSDEPEGPLVADPA